MKSFQRRIVTLLCFLTAMAIIASVFIFIDSNSVLTRDEYYDIGPVAMKVQGEDLDLAFNDIRNLAYVSKASFIKTAPAFLRMDQNDVYVGSPTDPFNPVFRVEGNAYYLSDDFLTDFPAEFVIVEGRYPENSSEIAIAYNDAKQWAIPIGRMMNYTHTLNGVKRTVFVVGIFRLNLDDPIRYAATNAIALVTQDVLNPITIQTVVYLDIDRDIISSIDPRGSLNQLHEIENYIATINPKDKPNFRFYVDNYLAAGVQAYIDSLNFQRSHQVSRTQLLLLLSGMLGFMAVRLNITMREEEINTQMMRGASRLRILRPVMSELWILSIFSFGISIVLGLFLSRIAWASTKYLEFNWQNLENYPLLLTVDTLIIIGVIGFLLPVVGYVAQRTVQIDSKKETTHGRLARRVNRIRQIQWDFITYALIGFLIFLFFIGGKTVNDNPLFLVIASLVEIPLFFAVASLMKKGLSPLSRILARVSGAVTGKIPASVGIRGTVRNSPLNFLVILILALMFSTCLINDVVATSLPTTHLAQTRYLIGGDLSFRLDKDESIQWNDFSTEVMQQEGSLSVSLVSIGHIALSEGSSGVIEFVAINPEQFSHIGYAYTGERLDISGQATLLEELELNPEGVILTGDIASEYNLVQGDILRALKFGDDPTNAEFNIIGLTPAIPRPTLIGQVSAEPVIGTRTMWLNRNYVETYVHLNVSTETYLCVKTIDGGNPTRIGEDALAGFETVLHSSSDWSSTTTELQLFYSQPNYHIDRSLDSMITISLALCILVAFTTFHVNNQRSKKGEQALLKTLGANTHLLLRVKIAEAFTLIIVSFVFIAVFAPLSIADSLRIGILEYNTSTYMFPVSIMVSTNWISFLSVATFLMIPSLVLVIGLSIRKTDSSIADVLRETEIDKIANFSGENV